MAKAALPHAYSSLHAFTQLRCNRKRSNGGPLNTADYFRIFSRPAETYHAPPFLHSVHTARVQERRIFSEM